MNPVDPDQLDAIARRHGIRLIVQFGSTVTGRTRPDSDIDLAVQLDAGPFLLARIADIERDLQSVSRDRNVDLALINRADPLLLKQIAEHGRLLFGTSRAFAELKMYAFRRYQDHRRFLDMERACVAAAAGSTTR